jgi:hypothetical protein
MRHCLRFYPLQLPSYLYLIGSGSIKQQELKMKDPRINLGVQKLLEQIRQSGQDLPRAGSAPELIFEEVPEQPGWRQSQELGVMFTEGRPEQADDDCRMRFFGLRGSALMHRVYDIPRAASLESIVSYFEVGSHGAESYGFDRIATPKLVAEKASQVCSALPCVLVRANCGTLELWITREVSDEDLDKIGEIFSDCDPFEAGAEFYVTGQQEGRHLFQPVQDERTFCFGWD